MMLILYEDKNMLFARQFIFLAMPSGCDIADPLESRRYTSRREVVREALRALKGRERLRKTELSNIALKSVKDGEPKPVRANKDQGRLADNSQLNCTRPPAWTASFRRYDCRLLF